MAGRAQAFSDPTVIQLASEQFIPVAENSSALERQQDDKGAFFRHVAEQGHYGGRTYPTSTRQGSYTFTAEGQFLASVNTREAVGMEGMLRTALDRWRAGYSLGGPSPVQLAGTPREDTGYPAGGLVLQVAARDLPRAIDERPDDWRKVAWNLDYAWLRPEEARALVPESRELGARRGAPWPVMRRIARFHLRDFVRGEPSAWPEEALREGAVTSTVIGVEGDRVTLRLDGRIRLEHTMRWRRPNDGSEHTSDCGYDASLAGEAVWDSAARRFVSFDLAASGPRWGTNQYNNRGDDLGPAPMGIVCTLAGSDPKDRTPPHQSNHRGYWG